MPSPGLLEFWALASVTVAVMCCTFLSPMSPSHQIVTLEGRDGIQFLLQTLPVAKGLPHSRHLVCAYRTGYIREIGKKKDKPQNEKYCPATTQTVALTKKKKQLSSPSPPRSGKHPRGQKQTWDGCGSCTVIFCVFDLKLLLVLNLKEPAAATHLGATQLHPNPALVPISLGKMKTLGT